MLIIKEPQKPLEISRYYLLRWQILREPWGQLRGSEKDKLEEVAHHLMVVTDNNPTVALAVGRIHLNTPQEAQIRYMAVAKRWERQGIGSLLLKKLEDWARKTWKAKRIILNAREKAIGFYEKRGYLKIQKAHTLFGEIPHYLMKKELDQ